MSDASIRRKQMLLHETADVYLTLAQAKEIKMETGMNLTLKSLAAFIVALSLPLAHAATAAGEIPPAQQSAAAHVMQKEVASAVYELAYSPTHNDLFVLAPVRFDDLKSGKKPQVIILNGDMLALEGAYDLPAPGFGVVLDDSSNTLYIGTGDASVIAWDTVAHKVKGEVKLAGPGTEINKASGKPYPTHSLRQLWLDTSNQRLYIPGLSWKGSVLYVIDTKTFSLVKTVEGMGSMPTGIAQEPNGGDIFLTNWQHEMIVVDSRTLTVKKRFAITTDQPLFLAWNAERKEILGVDEGMEKIYGMLKQQAEESGKTYQPTSSGSALVVLDPESGKTRRTIPTGKYPIAVKVDDKAGRVYVTGRGDGTVSVYSTRDYRLLNKVTLGAAPNSIAINPEQGSIFVSIKRGEEDKKADKEKVAKIGF